jgi:dynein light intermediate chain 1
MLQKQTLKHNTTNRDHILVPPNFDSWGKIRILTEDFNVEEVSEAWTRDIQADMAPEDDDVSSNNEQSVAGAQRGKNSGDTVSMYEEVIRNPQREADLRGGLPKPKDPKALEIESKDTQAFLSEQSAILEGLSKEDERSQQQRETKKSLNLTGAGDVEEHIGPVQFNMGGIQMDAEDMVKRLKVCMYASIKVL